MYTKVQSNTRALKHYSEHHEQLTVAPPLRTFSRKARMMKGLPRSPVCNISSCWPYNIQYTTFFLSHDAPIQSVLCSVCSCCTYYARLYYYCCTVSFFALTRSQHRPHILSSKDAPYSRVLVVELYGAPHIELYIHSITTVYSSYNAM